MLLIPLVDRCIYPALAAAGYRLSLTHKIAIGFGFATASVVVAGFVERWRKAAPPLPAEELAWRHAALTAGNGTGALCSSGGGGGAALPISSLSVWWQVPQYVLIGLGEVFAAVSCYELFYVSVPAHVRSTCQALNLLCTAFGSLAAAGLNSACAHWVTDNLDEGHLEYVFWLLGGAMAADTLLFLAISTSDDDSTAELPGADNEGEEGGAGGGADAADAADALARLSAGSALGAVGPAVRLSASRLSSAARASSSEDGRGATSSTCRRTGTTRRTTGGSEGDAGLGEPLIAPTSDPGRG